MSEGGASGAGFVEVRNLVKRYDRYAALSDVSFSVPEGGTAALLGPSGCGKTTMLRCIAGLETPDAGSVRIGDTVVFDAAARIDLPPEKRGLGIVFQSYAIWPHMTVAGNVGLPLRVRRLPKAEVRERVLRVLGQVGLADWIDRPGTQLSGGQQQRVALARALVHEPRLVLFDEALSNLDAQLREQVRLELKQLQDRLGFTAIYVTHDQAEAFGLAERLVMMSQGRIEATGDPRSVFHRPPTAFVARFLGLNVLEGMAADAAGSAVGVLLPDGTRLAGIPVGEMPRPGTPVLLGVRKEHLRLGCEPGGKGEDEWALPAQLRASAFNGLTEEYVLAAAGVELKAVQPGCGLRPGDAVLLRASVSDCVVLPAV